LSVFKTLFSAENPFPMYAKNILMAMANGVNGVLRRIRVKRYLKSRIEGARIVRADAESSSYTRFPPIESLLPLFLPPPPIRWAPVPAKRPPAAPMTPGAFADGSTRGIAPCYRSGISARLYMYP
jgi:hypothetical protein